MRRSLSTLEKCQSSSVISAEMISASQASPVPSSAPRRRGLFEVGLDAGKLGTSEDRGFDHDEAGNEVK